MRKIIAALAVALAMIVGLGVGGAQASASVSNADGKMSGQRAAAADPGYYGNLWAYPTACVVAERKDGSAHWVRNGFSQGQTTFDVFRVCHDSTVNPEAWRIHTATYPVYGLRFVSNQGLTKVLCDDISTPCSTKLA